MALLLVCKRWQVILKTKESNIKTKHTRGCQIEVTFFFFFHLSMCSLSLLCCAGLHPSSSLLVPHGGFPRSVERRLYAPFVTNVQVYSFASFHVTTVCIDEWCALRGEEAGARWQGLLCCPARQERPPLCRFAGGFVSFSC